MHEKCTTLRFEIVAVSIMGPCNLMVSRDDLAWTYCFHHLMACVDRHRFLLQDIHNHVEIKCQLDATEVFIADLIGCSTCFGHHYAHHQEFKSITQWLLSVIFRAVKM